MYAIPPERPSLHGLPAKNVCNACVLIGVQGRVHLSIFARRSLSGALVAALVVLALPRRTQAEDVTTLSGTTYHEVRLVLAEPDGVTWEHSTGVAKVDFTDLPDPVRRQYHYDAGKAAAFQAAQARQREQFAAQARQVQQEAEAHRVQRFQAQTAADPATAARPGEFVYRRRAAEAAAEQSVGEGIAAKKAAEDFRTKDDGTIWDRRLWTVPKLLFGSNPFDGVSFNPKTDFNSQEFKMGAHHAPGAFAPDSAHDSFYEPIYQTKSYYDDVERAEAFARGKP